ncbi:acyl-CoA thioesterase [Microbacterium amylolyticum]|uniref:acyl-CoA thioesterase n=1 Tax=Microbacterium amylolyticum TaxID=936337 RepID=UPI003617FC03
MHLRWGDQDAFGHVNNATFAQLLEEARVRAFWEHEDLERRRDTAVFTPQLMVGDLGPFFTLIVRNEFEYLAPIPYLQEPLDVQMWFSKLGGSSAQLMYEVRDAAAEVLFARAASTLVLVLQKTGRPVRLPDPVREAWSRYLGEPIAFTRR